MEIIIILLIIFFVTNSKKNQAKKAQNGGANPSNAGSANLRSNARELSNAWKNPAGDPPPKPSPERAGFREFAEAMEQLAGEVQSRSRAKSPIEAGQTPIEAARAAQAAAAIAASKKAAMAKLAAKYGRAAALPVETEPQTQGDSLVDEEGCVGGSMEHAHTEGERHETHARHIAEAKRREAEELLSQAEAERRAQMNARRLRDAVVMAEVLGKPKALRGRGQIAR